MTRISLTLIAFVLFVSASVSTAAMAGQDDKRLDGLFRLLQSVKTETEARGIEAAIWQLWIENKDQLVAGAMERGTVSMQRGELNEALESFDAVTRAAPDFAEGWNKRATVLYLMRDFDGSVRDIARTLKLEPRHFGALSGLGLINAAIGRTDAAIKAYEKALAIHPHQSNLRRTVKRLRRLLKGEET
ncbi:MAG: tetratricopeptide repeat protein [Proteobacteria bacterium]|nr:tetratricopeptide repeat protein [Pseudomonadota bacterium]